MNWVFNDGGREEAGYKGFADDCVCRAFAIASGKSYKEIYDLINSLAKNEKISKHHKTKSNARNGVRKNTGKKLAEILGFKYISTMKFGEGCKMHLTEDEIPSDTIVVQLSKHLVCVKNKVINDTYNSSIKQYYDCEGNLITNDKRCVYGYFVKE